MSKSISTRLIIANLIAVVVAIAGGCVGIFSLQDSITHYRRDVRDLQSAEHDILRADIHFKSQVQEWKNILLRGKDLQERENIWKRFELEEAIVATTLGAVEAALPADFDRQLIREFRTAHYKLFGMYREGFEAFRKSGGDPFAGDAVVIGIDREPNRILGDIVAKIGNESLTVQAEADIKARNSIIVAIATMVLAFIASLAFYASMARKSNQIEEELRIGAVAFESRLGVAVTDANKIFVRVNHSFTDMTGYEAADVFGKTPKLLQSGRHDAKYYAAMWLAVEQHGFWQGEIWNRRKNGEIYPEWLTITVVRNAKGRITHYVGSSWDITRRVEDETRIRNLAFYDPLTGLANRRLLTDRLGQAFAKSVRSHSYGAVLFIDLDRFKELNDTLGHAQGDRLLEMVADRLTGSVRETDTVARFGGDEFVILLEELDNDRTAATDKAMAVAEKLRGAVNIPYKLQTTQEKDWHCSPSIGVAPFLGHEESIEAVLANADKALYAAKRAGRNLVRLAGID